MFLWGTAEFESSEGAREEYKMLARDPDYNGMGFERSDVTGKMEAVEKTPWLRYLRIAGSICVILLFILLVYITVMFAMWVKLDPDNKFATQIGSLINAVSIVAFGKIYEHVAVILNNYENHRTQTQYEDAQITKSFMFQAVNNFFVLFFIAFLKQGTIDSLGFIPVDGRNSTCVMKPIECVASELHAEVAASCIDGKMEVPSCMSELQVQLLIVFCLKQVLLGSLEITIPFVKARARATLRELELETLKADGAHPNDLHATNVGEEHMMEPYGSVFGDYNELAIQFGYSTLFAVALPVAPLLAMINNCVEMRSDAYVIRCCLLCIYMPAIDRSITIDCRYKLCRVHRRPAYATRQDIGSWLTVFGAVLKMMNFVSKMMNFVLKRMHFDRDDRSDVRDDKRHAHGLRRLSDRRLLRAGGVREAVLLAAHARSEAVDGGGAHRALHPVPALRCLQRRARGPRLDPEGEDADREHGQFSMEES